MKSSYQNKETIEIALAGNPNVGKSTVFNGLTGMHQHTGNWPGKTVANASGYFESDLFSYNIFDTPGTYSLMSHSPEEEIARDYICFGEPKAVINVLDATCLERNLNLTLQIIETGVPVVICLNLLDEAKKKKLKVDAELLSQRIGMPVIGTVARKKKNLEALKASVDTACQVKKDNSDQIKIEYPECIEKEINKIELTLQSEELRMSKRFIALRLLENDDKFILKLPKISDETRGVAESSRHALFEQGFDDEKLRDTIASSIVKTAEKICNGVITIESSEYNKKDRTLDAVFTSKIFGYPIMLLMLALVFWLTIRGANYPSQLLSNFFAYIETNLEKLFTFINAPTILSDALLHGVFRVLSFVISVMLPPMAIFFPFFTLLEDSGYLPRIAYNLDKPFKCCGACGKQALTMCMGFGCNAAGVVGCRIINSKRERLLAIITNSLVPCNGRFPTLIALITMFFVSSSHASSFISAAMLTFLVVLCIISTFLVTKLLSSTLLRGSTSSFVLEMPPYRTPQLGKVIVRSIFDRTLFVLGRSVAFAAPAGLVIWLLANVNINEISILAHCASFLDPIGTIMGLDGTILLAFILGLPANEIVIPIIIMSYLSNGTITDFEDLAGLRSLLISNGWDSGTALSMIIFTLFHWPCSTTLMTIKKESGSLKVALISFAVPTIIGFTLCVLLNLLI